MIYTFSDGNLGRCQLDRRTAGKQGFCAPKLFTVSTLDLAVPRSRTYRFVDRLIAGLDLQPPHDHALCRIAITQFLAESGANDTHRVAQLDLALAPFQGRVVNGNGANLSYAAVPPPYARVPASASQETSAGM